MTDPLDILTDAELNECFAVEVGEFQFTPSTKRDTKGHLYDPVSRQHTVLWADGKTGGAALVFSTDANAVLPWLEKHTAEVHHVHREKAGWMWVVQVFTDSYFSHDAEAPTLARAAVIALIRAKRAGGTA